MILLSDDKDVGINLFYPAFLKFRNGREIPVVDWSQYRELVPTFVACNFLISALLICTKYFSETEYFEGLGNLTGVLLLSYIVFRMKFAHRIKKLKVSAETVQLVAPKIVWLEYTSMGIMFFLVGYFGALKSDTDVLMKPIFVFMQCFYSIYAVLPFLNHFFFSKKSA